MHITIVGAGIIGIQSAHALLDDGHSVTLVDPDGLGQRTSRGNAGGIVHTDILPLASPKVWRHIPRWLVDPLGPFAIRPSYALSILPWLLGFVRASTPGQVERSTRALIALNGASLAAWERRLGKLGLEEKHLRRLGYACIFSSKQQFEAAQPTLRRQETARLSPRAPARPRRREKARARARARCRGGGQLSRRRQRRRPRKRYPGPRRGSDRPRREARAGRGPQPQAHWRGRRDATELGTSDIFRHGRDRRGRLVASALPLAR